MTLIADTKISTFLSSSWEGKYFSKKLYSEKWRVQAWVCKKAAAVQLLIWETWTFLENNNLRRFPTGQGCLPGCSVQFIHKTKSSQQKQEVQLHLKIESITWNTSLSKWQNAREKGKKKIIKEKTLYIQGNKHVDGRCHSRRQNK